MPAIVFALAEATGWANSVIPACQNLMLAARALGIGSIPTTLHPKVMDRFHAMFEIPKEIAFHFCIPLGYPAVKYGPSERKPITETTYLDRWGRERPVAPAKPAVSLAAVPGRRRARSTWRSGWSGRVSGHLLPEPRRRPRALRGARAPTREIPFGTSIANIYTRHPLRLRADGGVPARGVGRPLPVRHRREPRADARSACGIEVGKPLDDMRRSSTT